MINIIIVGANGKMGKKVRESLSSFPQIKAVCGVDLKEDLLEKDFPVYSDFSHVDKNADVLIDFSSPTNFDKINAYALKTGVKCVLCTTGYDSEQIDKVKALSEKTAVFRSANMSLGVNVLLELVKTAAKSLYGFDVEIIEKHHNEKKDAPSGTALMIADKVKEVSPEKYYVYGREGVAGARDKKEIGIHAVRGGNIVGEHQIIFAGDSETVTLTHEATDRKIFAVGALKAAEYIATKKVGLFDMSDMINGK